MADALETDLYPSRVAPRAQLLKRKDAITCQDGSWDAPLSGEQTRSYTQNGFLVLEHLFAPEEVSLLKAEAMRLRAKPESLNPETLVTEIEPDGTKEIRSIFQIHKQNPLLARLSQDARLVKIAQFLLNDAVYIHQSHLDYKPAFQSPQSFWRSDFETWHVEDGMPRMRTIAISLLLTEASPANGPIMFLIGSHRHFVSCVRSPPRPDQPGQCTHSSDMGVPDRDNLSILAQSGIAMPTGHPGTLIIFDGNIMRGSNSNITPLPRSNAFFAYNALSNALQTPFGNQPPRPDYLATRQPDSALTPIEGQLDKHS